MVTFEVPFALLCIHSTIVDYLATFATVGIASTCILIFVIGWKLYVGACAFILARLFPKELKTYGRWAVITGGLSGIGKSYAFEMARRGMDVLVIGDDRETLHNIVEGIKDKYDVECFYIHVDFIDRDCVYDYIRERLEGMDVGVLVNAADSFGKTPCRFLEESDWNVLEMIDLHIMSPAEMSLIILPSMMKKKKGLIVNVSSIASLFPCAFFSLYSSSKAFCDHFTRHLSWEYGTDNVKLQSLLPCHIPQRMVDKIPAIMKARICRVYMYEYVIPANDTFAKSAVCTVLISNHTTGYWSYEIIRNVTQVLRHSVFGRFCLDLLTKVINDVEFSRRRMRDNVLLP